MRLAASLFLVAVIILTLSPVRASHIEAREEPVAPPLRLQRGSLDARAAAPAAPTAALGQPAPGPYAIVQFWSPVSTSDRAALEATGVKLLEYLPDYAYLIRGKPAELSAAANLPRVYARTSFTLADKLAPALQKAMARGATDLGLVRVFGWPDEEGALDRELQRIGVEAQVAASDELLLQLAGLESVRWIEPFLQSQLLNDRARAIMNVEPAWQNHGLFGAGQIVAVADSGLDTGDMGTLSPDFAGRIAATHVLSTGGHWDDNLGHGTHVAGSLAGAGVQSGADPGQHDYAASYAGVAPEASLVIQAFETTPLGEIIGLNPDYYQLFSQAYDDGARLHSDSWGDLTGPISDTQEAYGGYPYGAQRTDQFLWDYPDMAIFFAAGNSGKDGTPGPLGFCTGGDGIVDPDSLLAPGTAKNVITVGAGESDRTSGGLGGYPWLLLNLCFSRPPIAADLISNNANGMAAFSSRGPTNDGRAKPDVVTPGTNIISNKSHHPAAGDLWWPHETNLHYAYSGGTSMATPLAAGAGVLIRQWLGGQGMSHPSGAAIKAVLLNTTHDMAPGQYDPDTALEIPYTRPNNVAGWGRVDLGFLTAPPPYLLWLDDHTSGLTTGDSVTYSDTVTRSLEVLTSTHPLRVILAWTDPPASLSASAQLVNDLDLIVTGPGSTTYYGNGVASGDRTNNVEGVIISTPPPGHYEIQVQGFNVPTAAQPYALAVGGPLSYQGHLTASKTPNVTAAPVGQTITYTYRITNTGNVTLTGVMGSDDKLGPVALSPTVIARDEVATGTLTYTLRASDLPGPITNTVRISGTTDAATPVTVTTKAIATLDVVNPAAITVVKSADTDAAEVGQTITYTYHVTNTGTVSLTGVSGWDDRLGPVALTPLELDPDEGATGTLTYTIRAHDLPGPITNTAYVTGTAASLSLTATAQTAAAVAVVNPAAIVVNKTPSLTAAEIGQTITYTYHVTNTGTVSLTAVSGWDDRLGPVALTPLELDPDEGATGTLTYTVRAHDLPRPITNTAYVTGTAVSLFLTATAQTAAAVAVVNPAAMVVNKTPSGTTAEVGQTITYTYRVTNTGTVTLVNVTGRDDRLGVVTFSLTALRPEENTIATLAHTVNVDDWPGPVTNTVHVTGTGDVGVPLTTTAQAIASVELTGPAAISVGKTVDTRTARLGQTITYSYRVTNTGTVTLSDVAGRDDKLGVLPFDITTLGPDESFTATLSYQVRATDLPGPLTNTVEVSGTAAAGLPLTAMAQDVATVFFETVYVPVVLKLVP